MTSNPATDVPSVPAFTAVPVCWVCLDSAADRVVEVPIDLSAYRDQDPELAAYTGMTVWLRRCRGCGFMQPEALPALPNYFERMYDTRWSDDWIAAEAESPYRDLIFATVLRELRHRVPAGRDRLLDVGAHVGRLVLLAGRAGWQAEGIELNPRTARFAAANTGRPVHQQNAHQLAGSGRRYDAVTLLDVLEHIPEPVAVLEGLHGLLTPGGWLAVKVPHGAAQFRKEKVRTWLRPGYRVNIGTNLVHISHFTPGSLTRALERAGFTDVSVTVGAPEHPPLAGRFDPAGRASRALRSLAYVLGRTVPGGASTPLGLNLQAYARRPT